MLKLDVSISKQCCCLYDGNTPIFEALVSTAIKGTGQQKESGKTPLGLHQIRASIGANQKENTVFVARRPTGETYTEALAQQYPKRDWILTRILWLSGLELGKNRLGNVDTMQRYIYIHGCPDEVMLGVPLSHGCIRMRNKDILVLFDLVKPGTQVWIHE